MQVFTLGLDSIDRPQIDPDRARRGWLFLTGDPPDPVVATEVYEPGGGAEPRVVNVSRESHHRKTRRMAEGVETLPETRGNDYKMRVLRVPALGVEAFWLKAEKPDEDLVVPFRSLDRDILTGQPYKSERFLERIRDLRDRTEPDSHESSVRKASTDKPPETTS